VIKNGEPMAVEAVGGEKETTMDCLTEKDA
jgi:hypothetical protein